MLWPRRVWWLAGELPVSAPACCVGCAAELGVARDSPSNDGASNDGAHTDAPISLYCSTCQHEHERQRDATRMATALAVLSGAVCALGLPLLRSETGLAGHLLATLLAAALPLAGLALPSSRLGGLGWPPRIWPIGRIGAVIEGAALADTLARSGIRCRGVWLPPVAYRPGVALVAVLALALAGTGYAWHHPRVWVLVLGSAPLTLSVDGAVLARLEPAQPGVAEGLPLRLPSGTRHLSARDDAGRVVADATATLSPGREHLFAPGGADECFWLERTGYGRDTTRDAVPLRSASRFFTLDASLDGWLSGSSPPPASDRRSTGGTLMLLRHSTCPRAPEPVRAASAAGP